MKAYPESLMRRVLRLAAILAFALVAAGSDLSADLPASYS